MKKENPYYNSSMWKGVPAQNFSRAQGLRNNLTAAEKKLWERLLLEPFKKYHFRRQHPLQKFLVDFYSHSLKLIIEVDGLYHQAEMQKGLDEERTEILKYQGLKVIRFTNEEILTEMEKVEEKLLSFIKSLRE